MKQQSIFSEINYMHNMETRPRYHANDSSRDVLDLDKRTVEIIDARTVTPSPSLTKEGFALVPHITSIKDFSDPSAVHDVHANEISELVKQHTSADEVIIGGPGILRFSERSKKNSALNNSHPARFIHLDVSAKTGKDFAERSAPKGKKIRKYAHINIWRALTQPDQDVPLTLCDYQTVEPKDLIPADAVFDHYDEPEWSFEGLVAKYNPKHKWYYYRDMAYDEVLLFTIYDSESGCCSPHSAFNHPDATDNTPPRSSIEMRAVAYWYD